MRVTGEENQRRKGPRYERKPEAATHKQASETESMKVLTNELMQALVNQIAQLKEHCKSNERQQKKQPTKAMATEHQ